MPVLRRETRKIQVLGGSTYTVSIPKRWVGRLGLEPGNYVSMELTQRGDLLIRSRLLDTSRERRAALSPEGITADDLERRLLGLLLAGYNPIEVQAKPKIDPEVMAVLRDLPRKVSGLELVRETENLVVLEDVVDPTRFSMDLAMERMYSLLRFSLVRTVDSLAGKNGSQVTEALTRIQDVERLAWIVLKQQRMIIESPALAEKVGVEAADAIGYAVCAQHMRDMGEACRYLLELVASPVGPGISSIASLKCVEVGNQAISACDKAIFAFTRNCLDSAGACLEAVERLDERIREVRNFVSLSGKGAGGCTNCINTGSLLETFRRVTKLAGNIAEIAFHKALTLDNNPQTPNSLM